ncbi:MAG: hypothetical protein AAGD23_08855 [Pseudomonadota bacterium]
MATCSFDFAVRVLGVLIAAPLLAGCLVSEDDLYRAAPVSVQIDDGRYDVQTREQGGSFTLKDRITVQATDNFAGVARDENGDFFLFGIHDIGDGYYIAANEVRGLHFRYILLRPGRDAILGWSMECFSIQDLGLDQKYDIESDFLNCTVSDRETLEAAAIEIAENEVPDFRIIPSAE